MIDLLDIEWFRYGLIAASFVFVVLVYIVANEIHETNMQQLRIEKLLLDRMLEDLRKGRSEKAE